MLKKWFIRLLAFAIIFTNLSLLAPPQTSFAENNAFEYVGQDSLFHAFTTPDTEIGVVEPLASDGKAARKILKATNTWDFQLRMNKGIFTGDYNGNTTGTTPLASWKEYDLYARVKVDFNDENASVEAFKVGVYSITAGNYRIYEYGVPLSSFQSNEWTDIKIGTYFPSLTDYELIYLATPNNVEHIISAVYVDNFYFKEAPMGVPTISLGDQSPNSPVSNSGGSLTIPANTVYIPDGELLDVKVMDINGEQMSFEVEQDPILTNSTALIIKVPPFTKGGTYTVEASYENSEKVSSTFEVSMDPLIKIDQINGSPVSYNGGTLHVSATTMNIDNLKSVQAQVYDANGIDVTAALGFTFTGNTVSENNVDMTVQVPPLTEAGTYTLQLGYGDAEAIDSFIVGEPPIITIGKITGDPVASIIGGEIVIPITTKYIQDNESLDIVIKNDAGLEQAFEITGTTVSANKATIKVKIPASTLEGSYIVDIKYGIIPSSTAQFVVTSIPYLKVNDVANSPISYKGGEVVIAVSSSNIADASALDVAIKDEAGTDVTETLSFVVTGNKIMHNLATLVITVPEGTPEGQYKVELESTGAAKIETSFRVEGAPLADILPITGSPVSSFGGSVTIPILTTNIKDNEQLLITVKDSSGADHTSLMTITGNKVAYNQANVMIKVPDLNLSQEGIFTVNIDYDGSILGSTQFRVLARSDEVVGNYTIEDSSFHYSNNALSVADDTASDGLSATMTGNSGSRDIRYKAWDFSMLKYAAPYDVYFKMKMDLGVGSSGGVVKIGVYDSTQKKDLITPRMIDVSELSDQQWKEFRIGTINPNYGVNQLEFYVEGMGNNGVSSIYMDHIVLKEVVPYVIQNDVFTLGSNATTLPDGTSPDNQATKVVNGGNVNVPALKIPIDADSLVAGNYSLMLLVRPDRVPGTDWDNAVGDVMGLSVHNVTTGEVVSSKQIYGTANSGFNHKVEYFGAIAFSLAVDPSHDYQIRIYPTKNVNNFPSFRVDSLNLTRVLPELHYDSNKYSTVYPYKLSPANQDGVNDFTTIYYHGVSGKTVDVSVYDEQGNLIKKIAAAKTAGANAEDKWDGTDDSGNMVANGLYTIEVKRSDNIMILRRNAHVISGVQLTKALVNPALDDFPKGVYYEAGNIPYIESDADSYLDRTFKDISEAGLNTVYLSNWHGKSQGIYDITLEKAAKYGLKLMGLPDSHNLFKFWDGNFWDSESLYSNDEEEMYNALVKLTNKALLSEHSEQLIGYLLWDEPRVLYAVKKERFRDNLSLIRRMLESIDPSRVSIINYTMPEDAEYFYPSNQTQALSLDLYPVANHYPAPGNFKHIGTYPNAAFEESLDASTLQVRKDLTNDAPVWMILQAHGEEGGLPREPIPSEIRAMTYEALGRGARGFSYFLYQSTVVWRGMVDYDYTRRPHIYGTIKQLMSEVEALKPTILDMRRIANVAVTTGGGGGASTEPFDPGYLSADVTTHESISTSNKYIVVVNHNAEADDDVTITIDRSKLGMSVKSIVEVSKRDGSESEIGFLTTADSYILSDVNFEAGDGKIFKLIWNDEQIINEVQDDQFGTWGAGSSRGVADISASDNKTAMKVVGDSNGPMDFYSYTSDAALTAGHTYDVYARVKVNYTTALRADVINGPSFPKPEGNAFTVGFDYSAGGSVLEPTIIAASSMENMFWTDVKVGQFTATTANIAEQAAYIYVSPSDNKANIESIYVDKFYYVEAGELVSIELGVVTPETLIKGTQGTVEIPVTTAGIGAGESLSVTVKNSTGSEQNFAITGNAVQTNKLTVSITVPAAAEKGKYQVEIGYGNTTRTTHFQVSEPGTNPPFVTNTGAIDNSLKVSLSPQKLMELLKAAELDENGQVNIVLDYSKNEVVEDVQVTFTNVSEWLSNLDKLAYIIVETDFGMLKVKRESIVKLANSATDRITFVIRKGSIIIECLVN